MYRTAAPVDSVVIPQSQPRLMLVINPRFFEDYLHSGKLWPSIHIIVPT